MYNFNIFPSNQINNNINNIQDDVAIGKIQQNLILMGFDIAMINKIILYFKIRTENEALDYLIKARRWNVESSLYSKRNNK